MSKIDTPWGVAEAVWYYDSAKTILHVDASDGGGLGVASSRELPAHLARIGVTHGKALWFEKDHAWCAVAVAYPQYFSASHVHEAEELLRRFFPAAYMRHFGARLTVADSDVLEQALWEDRTVDHFVMTGSFAAPAWAVPQGHVYVAGWRRRDEATAGFLVPACDFINPERLVLDDFPRWEPDRSQPFVKRAEETECAQSEYRHANHP